MGRRRTARRCCRTYWRDWCVHRALESSARCLVRGWRGSAFAFAERERRAICLPSDNLLDKPIGDARLHSVIDHHVRPLDFTPSEVQRVASETDGPLVPRLRALQSPATIFIDGIDERFNNHVEDLPINPRMTGEMSPNVWYFAQLVLVEVACQIRRINHHLKVFAAIRKEACARLPQ